MPSPRRRQRRRLTIRPTRRGRSARGGPSAERIFREGSLSEANRVGSGVDPDSPRARARAYWVGRPNDVNLLGSGIARNIVGRSAAGSRSAAEERLKAKFDVTHPQDALDGALAQLAGQHEDISHSPSYRRVGWRGS